VLLGHPAKRPQGIPEPLGERDEALAAEDDMGVGEAGVGQPEVIEPMDQRRSGDGDGEVAHVGEVRQAEAPRRMLLAEDHLALGAVKGPPGADAALQRAPDRVAQFRVAATYLLEDRDRPETRRGLQHDHDLAVPDRREGVGPAPLARGPLLGWQARVVFDPVCGRGRKPGLGRRDDQRVCLTLSHENPHLTVGDVTAGH